MHIEGKATSLWKNIFRLGMPQIRTFHMTWFAFFLCFFAWFGIAPLMAVVREDLNLSREQIVWSAMAGVGITVIARLLIGWLCDRIGPRLTYTWLLVIGSLPVMGIAFAWNFETFLLARLMIGVIGASFVITQYHTTMMFSSNCVGAANATSAGWGNLGGGVTQFVMPLLLLAFVAALGVSDFVGWRLAMVAAGVVCMLTGIAYFFLTQDTPQGSFKQLRAEGKLPAGKQSLKSFTAALGDHRVWALFLIYGACFGIELTVNNFAALYFIDHFDWFQSLESSDALWWAGLTACLFGGMNVFARSLGGIFGDRFGRIWGLRGRVVWLFFALFCEGLALMCFSQMRILILAVPALIVFSLFVQMSEGATFSVVPFVNRKALGAVAGIVGAGGNAGAVLAALLFKGQFNLYGWTFTLSWPSAFLIIGACVTLVSVLTLFVRFSPQAEAEAKKEIALANAGRQQPLPSTEPAPAAI